MKEGSGSLFKNSRKTTDNHPDFTGSIMLNGKEHWFSAWVKESPKAGKFFSVSVGKVKEPMGFKPKGQDEILDDTPFQEIVMLSHIKDTIGEKAIITMESYGVDEERRLISFEPQDLESILKDVIQVCADCCITELDRAAILELLN